MPEDSRTPEEKAVEDVWEIAEEAAMRKVERDQDDGKIGRRVVAYVKEALDVAKKEVAEPLAEAVDERRAEAGVGDLDYVGDVGKMALGPGGTHADLELFLSRLADAVRDESENCAEALDELARKSDGMVLR